MLSKNLEISLHRALTIAREFHHEYATLEHLLLSLSEDPDANTVMLGCGVDLTLLCQKLKRFLRHELSALVTPEATETKPTAGFQRVIHRAAIHVHAAGKKEVTGANVLAEMFSERESYAVFFLNEQNITAMDVMNFIAHGVMKYDNCSTHENMPMPGGASAEKDEDYQESMHASIKETKEVSAALLSYCVNLNKMAADGKVDVLVGREVEIERTIEILCRRTKNNPLYVGEPGVGKTAIVEGLALRIVRQAVPDVLKNAVIFSLEKHLGVDIREPAFWEESLRYVEEAVERLERLV
jgi:ATP-dependent Clp protease ATP-binding subunit ClpA